MDEQNIRIDAPRIYMYITRWAFVSVLKVYLINNRYVKSYMTS